MFLDSTVYSKSMTESGVNCYLRLPGHKAKCKPERSWANVGYPDSWNNPPPRTKSFGFKVFGYKISTSNSGFITFWIRGVSGNILHQIHALCLTPKRILY